MGKFDQLDRLAENEEWYDYKNRDCPTRNRKRKKDYRVPLDEALDKDGLPQDE